MNSFSEEPSAQSKRVINYAFNYDKETEQVTLKLRADEMFETGIISVVLSDLLAGNIKAIRRDLGHDDRSEPYSNLGAADRNGEKANLGSAPSLQMKDKRPEETIRRAPGLHPFLDFLAMSNSKANVHPLARYFASSIIEINGERPQPHPIWAQFELYSIQHGQLHPLCIKLLDSQDHTETSQLHPLMRQLCDYKVEGGKAKIHPILLHMLRNGNSAQRLGRMDSNRRFSNFESAIQELIFITNGKEGNLIQELSRTHYAQIRKKDQEQEQILRIHELELKKLKEKHEEEKQTLYLQLSDWKNFYAKQHEQETNRLKVERQYVITNNEETNQKTDLSYLLLSNSGSSNAEEIQSFQANSKEDVNNAPFEDLGGINHRFEHAQDSRGFLTSEILNPNNQLSNPIDQVISPSTSHAEPGQSTSDLYPV